MQAKRMVDSMIKEIRQIVDFRADKFLPRLTAEVQEMQDVGLDVEIQYGATEQIFSVLLIGKEKKGKNASSKTL